MTEDKLSGLFDEIRNESAQTSVSEVDQWIETAVAGAATIGLLATLKLFLIKKPLIMWSAFVTLAGGASLSAVVILSQPEVKEKQEKQPIVRAYAEPVRTVESTEDTDLEIPIPEIPAEKTTAPAEPGQSEDMGVHIPVRIPDLHSKLTEITPLAPLRKVVQGGNFTKLDLSGVVDVELTQGKTCSVEIVPESAKDVIIVKIENGTLHIANEPEKWNKRRKENEKEKIVVKVTMETLERINMSGATNLVTKGQFVVNSLELDMAGASDLNLNVKATKLKGDFSGAVNAKLSGECETMNLDISGAAEAELFDLVAKKATVDNSGAGHLEIYISESLVVDGSGASETYYKVDVTSKNVSTSVETSGAAVVKKR